MRDILVIPLIIFCYSSSIGQIYRQPSILRNECGLFYNDSLRRTKTVDSILQLTGIQIAEHPLEYARRLQGEKLSHIDSTYHYKDSSLTLNYYDKSNHLYRKSVKYLNRSNFDFNLVFDINGNEIFRETIDCNSYNLRFRYYFDKNNKMIIECIHSSSVGLERTYIYKDEKKTSILTDCYCDF